MGVLTALFGPPRELGAVGERGCPRDTLHRLFGRVAEWQTRWLQVPVSFGTWGFKSPFAHHEEFQELTGQGQELKRGGSRRRTGNAGKTSLPHTYSGCFLTPVSKETDTVDQG
jgi:hypothetical protein